MKSTVAAGFVAVTLAGSAVVVADFAAGASTGSSLVEETVRTLQAGGYHVTVNKSATAPLADYAVYVDVAC